MKAFYQNKIILLTGATSGVGADLTECLLDLGATVIGIGLLSSDFIDLKDRCNKHIDKLHCFAIDVTDRIEMIEMAEKIKNRIGLPNIIIANAGLGGINPGDCFCPDIDKKVMSVNYFGMINTFQLFLNELISKREGQLVAISSVAAFRGFPYSASYCASKSAQYIFLESWRNDLKKHNIKVNSIHPGFIRTRMTNNSDDSMPFILDVRKSTQLILKAIKNNRSQFIYPLPVKIFYYFVCLLPNSLFDTIFIFINKHKQHLFKKPRIY